MTSLRRVFTGGLTPICDEFLGSTRAHVERDSVALEQQCLGLLANCADQFRVPVAECSDRVPAVEIQYAAAIVGDDFAARRALRHEWQLPVSGDGAL